MRLLRRTGAIGGAVPRELTGEPRRVARALSPPVLKLVRVPDVCEPWGVGGVSAGEF